VSRSLRILHTADSHVGAALPSRPRSDRPQRGEDLVDSFERVVRHAAGNNVDLVIHAGDLFNRSKPTSRALWAAAKPLLDLAVAGIPVVIVPGNHERSKIPACVLLSHPNVHIITEPTTLTFRLWGTRVAVAAFPFLRQDSGIRFAGALHATGWYEARADVNILAVHQTFESATCGPADFRFRSGVDVVERGDVPAGFDYVAAGHIHRHQTLATPFADGPPIVYCGSPDRISFAETREPKGFVLIEAQAGRLVHAFVEHEVRPMSTVSLNVTALTPKQTCDRIEEIVRELPDRSVARLRLGGAGSDTLNGYGLSRRIRALRPDVLFSIAASIQGNERAFHTARVST